MNNIYLISIWLNMKQECTGGLFHTEIDHNFVAWPHTANEIGLKKKLVKQIDCFESATKFVFCYVLNSYCQQTILIHIILHKSSLNTYNAGIYTMMCMLIVNNSTETEVYFKYDQIWPVKSQSSQKMSHD